VLPFLDRVQELARLRRVIESRDGGLVCAWGRRRLGKSRLLQEAVRGRAAAWCVGDERAPALAREAVARDIARLLPGFDEVPYPSWDSLLGRYFRDAPRGSALVLDEFPALVARSPELPSILQRHVDEGLAGRSVALCGSSQRMMQGLVLDPSTPLYGRAEEIIRLGPLAPGWLARALPRATPEEVVRAFVLFGGVPRYWELLAGRTDHRQAFVELVLDPMGVLHDEPTRLLLDDARDLARASSLLALIGGGVARLSEIAARMGQPAGSLTRPLDRLVGLGLVERQVPWGAAPRSSQRSHYRVADPFLSAWYRWVSPARARLAAGQLSAVARSTWAAFDPWLGQAWESLARASVAGHEIARRSWLPAARWWGRGVGGAEQEIDVVAASADGPPAVLVGEVKLSLRATQVEGALESLRQRARVLPGIAGRSVLPVLWVLRAPPDHPAVLGPASVLALPAADVEASDRGRRRR
jgi:AAA+ ATPase superfamily predicted ATPase